VDGGGDGRFVVFEGLLVEVAPVAEALLAAGPLDEYAAHRLGGGGEEVAAALPVRARAPRLTPGRGRQAQVRFVDESGRLQRLPRPLLGELLGRQLPEFVVDEGK